MSAFIVSKAHISAILRALQPVRNSEPVNWQGPGGSRDWRALTEKTADQVGQMLLDECVRSVRHRYPDDKPAELPGPANQEGQEPYRFKQLDRVPTPVQALKLVNCLRYQSCEHPEWEQSEAFRFCEAALHWLIQRLPGYEKAPWDWDEPAAVTENRR